MKTWKMLVLLLGLGALGLGTLVNAGPADRPTLEEKVARADAILIATVHEVETKRMQLSILDLGSDGQRVSATQTFDLAVLYPERVLKTNLESMINSKGNKETPSGWMHMAMKTASPPKGELILDRNYGISRAEKGERKIWFLRRDSIISGHFFLDDAEPVTDARVQEIEKLISKKMALN